jgi:hypothetical protein
VETDSGFQPQGEVVADERGRIAVGRVGVRRDDRYAIAVSDDGAILLTPLASIPKRELLVWENKELRMSLASALANSAAGNVADLGDFTQYANDDAEVDDGEDLNNEDA